MSPGDRLQEINSKASETASEYPKGSVDIEIPSQMSDVDIVFTKQDQEKDEASMMTSENLLTNSSRNNLINQQALGINYFDLPPGRKKLMEQEEHVQVVSKGQIEDEKVSEEDDDDCNFESQQNEENLNEGNISPEEEEEEKVEQKQKRGLKDRITQVPQSQQSTHIVSSAMDEVEERDDDDEEPMYGDEDDYGEEETPDA